MHINVEVAGGVEMAHVGGDDGETRETIARWRSDARSRDPLFVILGARTFLGCECFSNDLGV
jgi:hypothetical protein